MLAAVVIGLMALTTAANAASYKPTTLEELQAALRKAQPRDRIRIEPGEYGDLYAEQVHGDPGQPIQITASDRRNPPIFRSIHLRDVSYLELSNLTIENSPANGINIDDGGDYNTPSSHIILLNLNLIGGSPEGNRDGIKLSGVDDFRVEECVIENWGTGGSAIDMVGCHRGEILKCEIRRTDEDHGGASGVQMKGGSSDIIVRLNTFEHAGSRAVNIGGSTGFEFFRPPLKQEEGWKNAEAKTIRVVGNTFVGSLAPIAFVGVDGAYVGSNTIYHPGRWALRILQETRDESFAPCQDGVFSRNLIVFKSDQWGSGGVNIGDGTSPKTFQFSQNFWYCEDNPALSKPDLPTEELEGVYGKDPRFRDAENFDFNVVPGSPADKFGAQAYHLYRID